MRELTDREVENIGFLTRYSLDFGLLEPTLTGLGKGIMDATAEYRAFLSRQKIHDYDAQPKGPDYKRMVSARIVTPAGDVIEAPASMYRPATKNGDPRVWFSRMKQYCAPGDILVSLWVDGHIWVLNATGVRFGEAATRLSAYSKLLRPLVSGRESVFEELLEKLREISARGFLRTLRSGDTGIGHLLETELGIKANSSKSPDYKGVEIKSTRGTATRTQTLFAKVPDWDISQLHSSRQMLQEFGYDRGDDFKLYCTVSSKASNSQGLRLQVDDKAGFLHEASNRPALGRPVTWRLDGLRDALAEKHADTFWVKAESRKDATGESIHFQSVMQTTKPILQQLAPMLAAGTITVDHLISRKGNKVTERGPLFKLNRKHFADLFAPPIYHDLRADGRRPAAPKHPMDALLIEKPFHLFD
ncbi:MvaI/BcnI family restriction endonuclease [Arthrobacter sp. B3I4]|uniref:MvaI/BcnI family restriction endonuclease n=1 Tax=Arthrobacter sp. B3I4 TaxID=3042267 RepID=UPI00278A7669|nr:MvaI/BcnI family restriction endonuclease [Arthrobacter sp. B3I4]MDQ0757309.1 hypothetical protein [Arthrobacter sp. B3I4]